jgi:hypothetical protein
LYPTHALAIRFNDRQALTRLNAAIQSDMTGAYSRPSKTSLLPQSGTLGKSCEPVANHSRLHEQGSAEIAAVPPPQSFLEGIAASNFEASGGVEMTRTVAHEPWGRLVFERDCAMLVLERYCHCAQQTSPCNRSPIKSHKPVESGPLASSTHVKADNPVPLPKPVRDGQRDQFEVSDGARTEVSKRDFGPFALTSTEIAGSNPARAGGARRRLPGWQKVGLTFPHPPQFNRMLCNEGDGMAGFNLRVRRMGPASIKHPPGYHFRTRRRVAFDQIKAQHDRPSWRGREGSMFQGSRSAFLASGCAGVRRIGVTYTESTIASTLCPRTHSWTRLCVFALCPVGTVFAGF